MIPIPFEYETLRVIWWGLLGVLLIGLAIMDGFDMGVAFLNPILGRTDSERRVIINTVGPVWDGNQVWLITGGGAIFAAWPFVYAASFSGFYLAMFLVLLSLILRPVSFEFRNKFTGKKRLAWDYTLFLSGLVPPLVFGVAFGNLFLGVPFSLDAFAAPIYQDGIFMGFLHLLKPFALLTGLASVAMLATHGAVYLAGKSDGIVQQRATAAIWVGAAVWTVMFLVGGVWVTLLDGYTISSAIDPNGPSNPLLKTVIVENGVWLRNYQAHPMLFAVPGLAIIGMIATLLLVRARRYATAFIPSGLMVGCTIATAGIALFPFLMTSSVAPSHSLTVWDASSSPLTLWLMTIAAVIFVPIVLAYTSWAFYILRGAITEAHVNKPNNELY
jgi:cytochrome bd ubiquinol oxidase subunit II